MSVYWDTLVDYFPHTPSMRAILLRSQANRFTMPEAVEGIRRRRASRTYCLYWTIVECGGGLGATQNVVTLPRAEFGVGNCAGVQDGWGW
jgi:hypothetical protein